MKNIKIKDIIKACEGVFHGDESILEDNINGVVIDSRLVQEGYVFVAIQGERSDGHDFAKKAIESGAVCCISEKRLDDNIPHILVKSSAKALQEAAKYYRSILDIKVIGITGSVGKTSTKEMISAVVSQKYATHKTQGNYNNELGLPLTIFQIEDYHKIAVLEMGISDFGEMHLLADIARPDICVITNIGLCHLDTLKSRDGILKAKSEIFDFINDDTVIILNGDDDKLVSVEDVKGIKPYTFGINNTDAGIVADNIITDGLSGVSCDINSGENTVRVNVPIPGNHMVYNACAGYLAGKSLGLSDEEIVKGIACLVPVDGRNNIIKTSKYTVIDDCYNANPVSMKAAIDVLSGAEGRKVAILGDMFELGDDEEKLHREVGDYLVGKSIDAVVCVGSLSKNIIEGCSADLSKIVKHYETREEFLSDVKAVVKEGDIILVKASHGMGFDKVVEVLTK